MALRRAHPRAGRGDAVAGYILLGLATEEWYHWDALSDPAAWPADPAGRVRPACYHPATRAAFQAFLAARYDTIGALDAAWGRTFTSFADVPVPSEAELRRTGELRPLPDEANAADFFDFRSRQVVDTIDFFAAALKTRTAGRALTGALYGYMSEFRGNPTFGHSALGAYGASGNLDLMLVEPSYAARQLGGADLERSAIHSLRRAGKLVIYDDDAGTIETVAIYDRLCELYYQGWASIYATCDAGSACLPEQKAARAARDACLADAACLAALLADTGAWNEPPATCAAAAEPATCRYIYRTNIPQCMPARREDALRAGGVPPGFTLAQNESMLLRFAGFALAHGLAFNYFSLHTLTADQAPDGQSRSTYSHPELLAFLATLNARLAEAATLARHSVAQILVLSDERSTFDVRPLSEVAAHALDAPRLALHQIGAPYDHALLADLPALDVSRYRLVVMLDAFELPPATRATLASVLARDGRVIVWNFAPGVHGGTSVGEVTGIAGAWLPGPAPPTFDIPIAGPGAHPLQAALWNAAWNYGQPTGPAFGPACCAVYAVDDPAAVVLATYHGTSTPSLALADRGSWTSVWAASVDLPPQLWREIARYAGVHLYGEANDTLYADDTFLTVHGYADGPRTLSFPAPVTVTDFLTGAPVPTRAGDPSKLDFALSLGETRLFRRQ